MYFTDARDLESLISLFEDNGYLLLSRRDADMVPIDKLITKLFSDGPLSIAVCVSMFGLAFCVVYIILILFRDITPTLSIHYLFGLSFRRIVCNGISISVFLIILASILSHYLLTNSLTYLSRIDLQKIFKISFVIYFALVGFIDVVGFYCLSRRLRGKGGK